MQDDDEDERSKPAYDGLRPEERVGPDECEAPIGRTEYEPEQEPVDADECDFDAEDHLHEQFRTEPIAMAEDPVDGLPRPVDPDMSAGIAHPFTYENQLCIEDDREWVEVFREDLGLSRLASEGDEFLHFEVRSRYDSDGVERPRACYKPSEVSERWGVQVVFARHVSVGQEKRAKYTPVRPRRPRCKYYKRQVVPFKDEPSKQFVHRLCTIRRSNGGAFMTVSDTAIVACDLRDPPDAQTSARQDRIDRATLEGRPDRTLVPLYGMSGDEIRLDEEEK